MKALHLDDVLQVIDGELKTTYRNILVNYAVRRSRNLQENTLYFHMYKNKGLNWFKLLKHQTGVIITENAKTFQRLGDAVPIVQVKNINKAYWQFIEYYRNLFHIPVIGITGTSGKSTTKEMVKHILSDKLNILSNYKSINGPRTHFGYLMQMDDLTQAAVMEMAVINPGNIALGIRYFKPQIRVLLNIGVYHLVGCKTPQNYFRAKSEILNAMDPINDVIILNGDDENIKKIDTNHCQNVVYFGYDEHCQWQAKNVTSEENGISFTFTYEDHEYKVFVPGLGHHNMYNALAAIAAANQVGIEISEAIERLKSFEHLERHLEQREGPNRCTILDDNWNNTPTSMEAALRTLKEYAGQKRKIAVLGYMFNLGNSKYAKDQYAKMGKIVAEVGIDQLVIIGDRPAEIGKKAIEAGMDENKVYFINRGEEVRGLLTPFFNDETVILIKAPEYRKYIQL